MTTVENVTPEQIARLREAARKALDSETVEACDLAVKGDMGAIEECVFQIRAGERRAESYGGSR